MCVNEQPVACSALSIAMAPTFSAFLSSFSLHSFALTISPAHSPLNTPFLLQVSCASCRGRWSSETLQLGTVFFWSILHVMGASSKSSANSKVPTLHKESRRRRRHHGNGMEGRRVAIAPPLLSLPPNAPTPVAPPTVQACCEMGMGYYLWCNDSASEHRRIFCHLRCALEVVEGPPTVAAALNVHVHICTLQKAEDLPTLSGCTEHEHNGM